MLRNGNENQSLFNVATLLACLSISNSINQPRLRNLLPSNLLLLLTLH